MNSIARGQVISAVAPALGEWLVVTGLIIDLPTAASWEVFDTSTDERELAPVSSSAGPHAPVQTADLSFVPSWTVPALEPLGRHEIRWTLTLATGAVMRWCRVFDVVEAGQRSVARGYALVSDMRREGIGQKHSDARVAAEIASASKYIERVTRRWFEPRRLALDLDGSGHANMLLDHPVIGLESIQLSGETATLDLDTVKVYNRHIAGGEDDRSSPKLSFSGVGREYGQTSCGPPCWRRGTQNVNVAGLFGYTDFDGSPTGETPELIRKATRLLVVRGIEPMTSARRADAQSKSRLTGERTREQSYTMSAGREGAFTGDVEVDDIILMYCAPPRMETV